MAAAGLGSEDVDSGVVLNYLWDVGSARLVQVAQTFGDVRATPRRLPSGRVRCSSGSST